MNHIINHLKNDLVLTASMILAFVSMFIIPPSSAYVDYIDVNVILILFCLMAVISGLTKAGLFNFISFEIKEKTNNVRVLSFILIFLCFFLSMFVTNDVALITFVPFTIALLKDITPKVLIKIIVMETIAANLGSMMTPIGNPQNLYLYSFYDIKILDFIKIMFPLGFMSFLLVTAGILIIKDDKKSIVLEKSDFDISEIKYKNYIFYLVMFMICILGVLEIISTVACFLIITFGIFISDKNVLKDIDYGLLFTFLFFFIFTGNISSITSVNSLISQTLVGKELVTTLLLSQILSNVPATLMLSNFTSEYELLLKGSNIGGLGSIVASLASLISFRYYIKIQNADIKGYLINFTAMNLIFLFILFSFTILGIG